MLATPWKPIPVLQRDHRQGALRPETGICEALVATVKASVWYWERIKQ